jgi:hypothetical protein
VRSVGWLLCLSGCPYLWGPPAYVERDGQPAPPQEPEPEPVPDTSEAPQTAETGTEPPPTDTAPPEPLAEGTFEGAVSIECVGSAVVDTCAGEASVVIEASQTLTGNGICSFPGEMDVAGVQAITLQGQVAGSQASGELTLPLFTAPWEGALAEPADGRYRRLTGGFVGQLQLVVPGHGNTDFVCTGAFSLDRQ